MGGKKGKLAEKHALFVERYLVHFNAAKAAEEAGFSKKTARTIGSKLLTRIDIAEAILQAKEKRLARAEITADQVIAELALIARSDLADMIRVNEDGTVQVLPLDQMRPEARRAIGEITQTSTERFDPESKGTVEKIRLGVKLHSKVKALELLMHHFGLHAPQKVDVSGTLQVATAKATLGAKLDELGKRVAVPAEPGGEPGKEPGATG